MKQSIPQVIAVTFYLLIPQPIQSQDDTGDVYGWPHNNVTPTWEEGVRAFQALADQDERAHWMEIGTSDAGKPIHALVLSQKPWPMPGLPGLIANRTAFPADVRILVNNAIHPGEPCGVDASLAFARQLLELPFLPDGLGDEAGEWDEHGAQTWRSTKHRSWAGGPKDWGGAVIAIIPFYNVGGTLNRGCCSRANQNGPLAYGFRGNARNFDLNRDFMKMDTQNASTFARFYTAFDPDLFIDTHTTNGADYPYTMTCITTQYDKAGPEVGAFLRESWDPMLYEAMTAVGYPMSPYVYSVSSVPDSGLIGFLETPRYSTGYGALWGTLGFTAEAHMLKPFPERVQAMLNFLQVNLDLALKHADQIKQVRANAYQHLLESDSLPIHWTRSDMPTELLHFHGYGVVMEPSEITGANRLRYNRDSPWEADVPFFNTYIPDRWATVPETYVIPAGWSEIIQRLRSNGVAVSVVDEPKYIELEVTYVEAYQSGSQAYEGHHLNQADSLDRRMEWVWVQPGDFIVSTHQRARRYLVEALELEAHDSFWVWGAFDSALQRKEGYSAYVFEDTAEALLERDEALKSAFEKAKLAHPDWQESPEKSIRWLYEHSPYSEPTGGRYPVMKSYN